MPINELKTPISAELIKVIETKATRGAGTDNDPARLVIQYWSLDGQFLAEHDPNYLRPDHMNPVEKYWPEPTEK